VASGTHFATIPMIGVPAAPTTVSPGTIDAMTDSPFPMVAYSVLSDGDLRAYIHLVPQRQRAVR
jgi:hypothetical protein